MRQDVLKTYKDVHSWVGIIAGMFLFIAFMAGALTMFRTPLTRWATPPSAQFSAPLPVDRTEELVAAVAAQHPKAADRYTIQLEPGPEMPARLFWSEGGRRAQTLTGANLSADGRLEVHKVEPSKLGYLADELHRRVGLPLPRSVVMPITGIVSMLYLVAIVSGLIVLLPSLAKDMFAVRVGRNLKRMWLDVHNVLGLFSLPFHIIIALTAIVFAVHDQIYDVQDKLIYQDRIEQRFEDHPEPPAPAPDAKLLPVTELLARIRQQAPGFTPLTLAYSRADADHGGHMTLRVSGYDDRYGHRSGTAGFVGVDPTTGKMHELDLMPGHQPPMAATLTSFFTLHFGSFGGAPVRWGYFVLGIAGAFLFYTGNLLWIESRRKRERRNSGPVTQSRQTMVLAALTVGVSLGSVIGVGFSIAATKLLHGHVANAENWHIGIYYALFAAAILWAFRRGAARAGAELLCAAGVAALAIPLVSLVAPGAWNHADGSRIVDWVAALLGLGLLWLARRSHRRARSGQKDSVWNAAPAQAAAQQP